MPSAIIADDEDLQRTDLRRLLTEAWPELQIVAECEDGADALEAIAQHQPDIAFLDIRMPAASGLDVARASNGRCKIVFTTAYDNHAIEAFNLGALDYLLKPVQQERLAQTVERLKAQLMDNAANNAANNGANNGSHLDLIRAMTELEQRLKASSPQAEPIRFISATAGNLIKIIPIDEVLFFESDTRYTRVVSASDEGLIRTPLKDLQKGLNDKQFWQIHRGTLVAVSAIACARRDDAGNLTVELKNHPEKLKVSQSWAWRFRGM